MQSEHLSSLLPENNRAEQIESGEYLFLFISTYLYIKHSMFYIYVINIQSIKSSTYLLQISPLFLG